MLQTQIAMPIFADIISTTTISLATKLGRVWAQNEEFPLKELDGPSITWSYEVDWQTKYITSLFELDQWKTKMEKWWFTVRDLQP